MGRWLAGLVVAATIVACGSDTASSEDGEVVASVDFEVSPPEIALGDVRCGSTKSSSIVIENKGGATLAWTIALPDGSPFVLKGESAGTLESGASATLPIDLAPDAPGDVQDTATVDVNGVLQQVTLKARGVGAVLVAEQKSLDFGEVRFDREREDPIVLRNDGNAPALVEGFEGSADALSIGPGGISIDPGAAGSFTAKIGAGTVTGAPATASLAPILAANTPHCGARPVIDLTGLRVNTEVTLSVADFGAQDCGNGGGATKDVLVTNYSNQPITYTAALPSGSVFTISSGAQGTIAAATGATPTTGTVKIAMGPTGNVIGIHEEALTLQVSPLAPPSGGTRTTKVRLDVHGALIKVTPDRRSFESDGKKADKDTFEFENEGNEPITLAYSFDRPFGTTWTTDATTQAFAPNTTLALTVFFKPSRDSDAPDNYSTTLKVARDASSKTAICSALPQPRVEGRRN